MTKVWQPYTYLIGWSAHKKYYYGVRFAFGCNPSDLWVSYFTSSNLVAKTRKSIGEPDIIQVRKTFSTKEKAISWETRVLRKMRVIHRDDFLNQNDIAAHPVNNRVASSETKAKISAKHMNKIISEKTKEKIRLARAKQDMSFLIGHEVSEKTRQKISLSLTGKIQSQKTKIKRSESLRGVRHQRVQCPYCLKTGGSRIMKRYHLENCKYKEGGTLWITQKCA